jgi:integrase
VSDRQVGDALSRRAVCPVRVYKDARWVCLPIRWDSRATCRHNDDRGRAVWCLCETRVSLTTGLNRAVDSYLSDMTTGDDDAITFGGCPVPSGLTSAASVHYSALCMTLPPVSFPADVAAARLGVKRRWLMEWLRANPCDQYGDPFYRIAGKGKLFTDADLTRILGALPKPTPKITPCRSTCRRHQDDGKTTVSVVRTSGSKLTEARALLTNARLAKRLKSGNGKSSKGLYVGSDAPTFASGMIAYVNAGHDDRFLHPLLEHFKEMPLANINQSAIDDAAVKLYPDALPATRNRQVYSPVSAILKRNGFHTPIKRPAGSQGTQRTFWLNEAQAFALLREAKKLHARFGALSVFLLYTGCRLNEALKLEWSAVELERGFAYVGKTKNGQPRAVYLPAPAVSALAAIKPDTGKGKVFRLSKSGFLYNALADASKAAGIEIPDGVAFHVFRHTYGAWMRRHAGLDTSGLVATGAWKSRVAASVYEHTDVSEEARKADRLPTPVGLYPGYQESENV